LRAVEQGEHHATDENWDNRTNWSADEQRPSLRDED